MRIFTSFIPVLTALILTFFPADAPAAVPDKAAVKRLVVEEAMRNGVVPPALALGVAQVESGFKPQVESHKGARGVMQIMPATARGEFGVGADALWDARTNIRLGVTYLERLYRQYDNRWDAALSHYNGGTLKNGRPHGYTRKYVADVMAWTRRFERDRTVSTLVASAATTAPHRAAGTGGSAASAYWMFDEPGIERSWRDYLKTADRWLNAPQDAFRDVWEGKPTTRWVPVDSSSRPSERLQRKTRDFRRGILNRINEAPDTVPVTGAAPRFG